MTQEILKIENLSVSFQYKDSRPATFAVRDISFTINQGDVLALVGESGCGKSVTAYSIMRIEHLIGAQRDAGKIIFSTGQSSSIDITKLSENDCKQFRGNKFSYIPQDPLMSLNPVLTIGEQLVEVMLAHTKINRKQAIERALDLLNLVGISDCKRRIQSFPHQLSGGLRQRVLIAMALACKPVLLIADEPTTALDVTIQAQVLDLLIKLKQQENMTILFITHDLAIVSQICNRVVVMYAGQIMEEAPVSELFGNPLHPYTIGLLRGRPMIDKKTDRLYSIPGQPPDLSQLITGCPFAPRCDKKMEICTQPAQNILVKEDHRVNCHLYD